MCTVLDDGQLSCESRTSAGSYASVDITGADGKCCPSSLAETAMLCRVKASLSLSFQFAANESEWWNVSIANDVDRVLLERGFYVSNGVCGGGGGGGGGGGIREGYSCECAQ